MFFPANREAAPELAAKLALMNPPAYTTFQKVLPFCRVREKSGLVTFMTAYDMSKGTALQENREETAAITAEAVATGSANYTLGLYEKRTYIAEREEPNYGTIDNLKNAGGTALATQFFLGLEKKFIAYLIGAADSATTMTKGSVIDTLQEACDAVAAYGKPVIILTRKALRTLRKNTEVREQMIASGKVSGNISFVLGTPSAFRVALADMLEIHEVIVADPTAWGTTYDNEIFVTAVRPESLERPEDVLDTIKAMPFAGFVPYVTADGEGADPYSCAKITIWGDNVNKRNMFDADGHLAFVCLDKASVKRFSLPADGAEPMSQQASMQSVALPPSGGDTEHAAE